MGDVSTGSTMIQFGSNLKIGYRITGSPGAFYYISHMPSYDELPYIFTLVSGTYDIEYTEVCPSCSLPTYSTSVITNVVVP